MCIAQLREGKIFLQYLEMVLKYLQLYSEGVMTLCSFQDYAGDLKKNHRTLMARKVCWSAAECSSCCFVPECSSIFLSQHKQPNTVTVCSFLYFPPALGQSCSWTQSSLAKPEIFTSPRLFFNTLIIFLIMLLFSFSFAFFNLYFTLLLAKTGIAWPSSVSWPFFSANNRQNCQKSV